MNETHTRLIGRFDKIKNLMLLRGCFETDGALGNVYVDLVISAHQRPGKLDIWVGQNIVTCANGALSGEYVGSNEGGLPVFGNVATSIWQANPQKGKGYDQDDDGVPTERELGAGTARGRRDPDTQNA